MSVENFVHSMIDRAGRLEIFVENTTTQPHLDIVALHGYSMDENSLLPFARSLQIPARWHVPRAPFTVADGGYSWWPVDAHARERSLAQGARDFTHSDPPHRQLARTELARLVREIRASSPGRPLLLCGFSQGGMVACDTLLHEDIKIDGLALMSSSRVATQHPVDTVGFKGLSVLQSHGNADRNVALAAAHALRDFLVDAGAKVDWVEFDGGHEIPLPVWRRLRHMATSMIEHGAAESQQTRAAT